MYRLAIIVAASLICAVPADGQRTGAGSSAADVPGHPSFRAGARLLAGDDWTGTDVGDVPESLALAGGTVEIVEQRGRRFLRVSESASFDVVLPEHLPESYTIDFDMLVPSSTGYSVEIRPDLPKSRPGYAGVSRRMEHPVVLCGAIGAGVYGAGAGSTKRFDDRFAAALVPCQIAVSAKGVKVYFAGQLAANMPGADLGRTNRVRLHVPADGRSVALIGPIRVATDVGADLVASGGAPSSEPAPVAEPATDPAPEPEPASDQPAKDPAPEPEPSSARSAARASRGISSESGSGLKELGDRMKERVSDRATARLDSLADRADRKVEKATEKAIDKAADVAEKALEMTDRVVSCLVTDLACIRRAKRGGANVAVTDSRGEPVSSADSTRAIARASQPPTKP